MKLYTYTGETPSEALRKAQSCHGPDPIIMHTKELRKKSLGQKGLYEVVIAVEEAEEQEQKQEPQNSIKKRLDEMAQRNFNKKKQDKITLNEAQTQQIQNTMDQISTLKQHTYPTTPPQQINQSDLKAIKKEIESIDDRLKLIQSMFWEERKPTEQGSKIPQEFAEIYNIAKNSGIDKEKLDAIMDLSLELMPLQMRSNSVTIKRYFREVLRKMITCRNENLELTQKNIIMFVGPTGVGKTTTLAKLAARYSLMLAKRYKVGIIALDTYKIAAMEQLNTYARMMKLAIERVDDSAELVSAIERLHYCDFILIDTAGHSQYDKQKLENLKSYVDNGYKIDVSLVLSASTKYEDLKDIYQSFSTIEIDSIIFSKLDESRTFGNVFSLICDTKKPVSYFSIGQSVPNDLLVANNEFLVDCLLEGFSKPQKDSL
ncbi:flagellar biosynthesis protein FlhF [Helicobacter enhydrae]|uniref:Flagellar biosynthesis protein FlhF n=1 Tax=Helicobacter enhydrae TaxID=222136 RepID=A0A1B1U4E3_9HELI|nr:flagellar biosynthesis protein FlhF [Helicobacter enhydrae]ANV97611.1 flagellar biosynthesis protein FlhF [Helicobacter enhydrae]